MGMQGYDSKNKRQSFSANKIYEAVSKCKLQENSPHQKLDKVVRIRFLMDSHDLFVGLIFR